MDNELDFYDECSICESSCDYCDNSQEDCYFCEKDDSDCDNHCDAGEGSAGDCDYCDAYDVCARCESCNSDCQNEDKCDNLDTCTAGKQTCTSCDGCDTCDATESGCGNNQCDGSNTCNNGQTCDRGESCTYCDSGCQGCETDCQKSACMSACETSACESVCQDCQTGCEVYFQGCGNTETECLSCDSQSPCSTADSCSDNACQVCEVPCQGACMTICEICEICDTNCQNKNTCNTMQTCDIGKQICDDNCDICDTCDATEGCGNNQCDGSNTCNNGQTCDRGETCTSCNSSTECQTCQLNCQHNCQGTCELNCQIGCQICQEPCMIMCQTEGDDDCTSGNSETPDCTNTNVCNYGDTCSEGQTCTKCQASSCQECQNECQEYCEDGYDVCSNKQDCDGNQTCKYCQSWNSDDCGDSCLDNGDCYDSSCDDCLNDNVPDCSDSCTNCLSGNVPDCGQGGGGGGGETPTVKKYTLTVQYRDLNNNKIPSYSDTTVEIEEGTLVIISNYIKTTDKSYNYEYTDPATNWDMYSSKTLTIYYSQKQVYVQYYYINDKSEQIQDPSDKIYLTFNSQYTVPAPPEITGYVASENISINDDNGWYVGAYFNITENLIVTYTYTTNIIQLKVIYNITPDIGISLDKTINLPSETDISYLDSRWYINNKRITDDKGTPIKLMYKDASPKTFKLSKDNNTITYDLTAFYGYTFTFNHLNIEKGTIAATSDTEIIYGDQIEQKKVKIDIKVKPYDEDSFKYTYSYAEPSEITTPQNQTINYYYYPNKNVIYKYFKDKEYKQLIQSNNKSYKYETEADPADGIIPIAGYEYVQHDQSDPLMVTTEDIIFNYYYKAVEIPYKINIYYKQQDGTLISAHPDNPIICKYNDFFDLNHYKKTYKDYTFIHSSPSGSGFIIEKDQDVIYYYKKKDAQTDVEEKPEEDPASKKRIIKGWLKSEGHNFSPFTSIDQIIISEDNQKPFITIGSELPNQLPIGALFFKY